jgi:serine/threonine protein kinase
MDPSFMAPSCQRDVSDARVVGQFARSRPLEPCHNPVFEVRVGGLSPLHQVRGGRQPRGRVASVVLVGCEFGDTPAARVGGLATLSSARVDRVLLVHRPSSTHLKEGPTVALVFGKYERIRRIAQGGMGEVFLARQTGVLDRLAILKALRADLSKEHEFVEQFLDEARVAATLNHPNIVAIFDVGDWQGTYYIAMEYIAGEDLSKLWYAAAKAGIGLPFQVSVRIIMEAALGLDHAHRAKDVRGKPLTIVHRDISPQNIMVRQDGVTKLVDFGIAKAANKNSRTQAGMVKGKLQYMSPEQVRGEPLDGRSDQFSLGIVLWEMCTGRRLFKADSEINTLQKILQTPVPKPTSHVPGFPAELEAIIMRMLERDINRRFASLGDVAARLKEYLDRSSVQSGEVGVAAFVQQILGKELDERIADLTPMEPTEASASTPVAPARQATRSTSTSTPAPTAKPKQSFYDDDKDAPTAIVSPEDRPDRGAPGSASVSKSMPKPGM